MKWKIHVVIYLGSIQNGAKAIMEENNLDRSRQQRETKNELDAFNPTFTSGSCKTNTPVINREGGMRIICTGRKDLVAGLKEKDDTINWSVTVVLEQKKGGGGFGRGKKFVIPHYFIDGAIVLTFPALCEDNKLTHSCAIFKDWPNARLAIDLENPNRIPSAYLKLSLNDEVILRRATLFRFASIVEDKSNQLDKSWYELKNGISMSPSQNYNWNLKSTYLILYLAHTTDTNDITNQMDTMNYWKDHFTLIFSKTAGGKNPSEPIHFISEEHSKNRKLINHTNQMTTMLKFRSIEVNRVGRQDIKDKHKEYPRYKIVLEYKTSKGEKTIPWDNPFIKFQIGEPDLPHAPKASEIDQVELANSWLIIAIAVGTGVIIIVIIVIVLSCVKVKNSVRKRTEKMMSLRHENDVFLDQKNSYSPQVKFDEFLEMFDNQHVASEMNSLYIPATEIEMTDRRLGKGQFGIASVAKYRNVEVCIKTCRIDMAPITSSSDEQGYNSPKSISSELFKINEDLFQDIFKEALQMKGFEHQNVMKVIGVSLDNQLCPQIILPLMDRGDLLTFVRNEANLITYKNAIKYSLEAARGMEYLSSKNVIHRDLAARNCLLEKMDDGRINLRIADFGLSKHVDDHYADYDLYQQKTNTKLPMKWLAPEVLQSKIFTTMSDVWAFGVLVWEVFTRGCLPYGALNGWQEIKNHLDAGNRLDKPIHCDDKLYELLMRCWHDQRRQRPNFADLASFFNEHYKKIGLGSVKRRNNRQLTMPKNKEDNDFELNYQSAEKANYQVNRASIKPTAPPRKSHAASPSHSSINDAYMMHTSREPSVVAIIERSHSNNQVIEIENNAEPQLYAEPKTYMVPQYMAPR